MIGLSIPKWVRRVVSALLVVAVLLAAAFLWFVHYIGAWNVLFPSHHHETTPPEIVLSGEHTSILLFTKTNAFRHKGAIKAGSELFRTMGEQQGWAIFQTENSAVFNRADLAVFDVVIFHNVTGNSLSKDQQEAFEEWLSSGGGWLGTHAAGDGSHFHWPWYMKNLIGVRFIAHTMGPQFQDAKIINEAPDHIIMSDLPNSWSHNEEWYSWERSARDAGFKILAVVDEATYNPEQILFGRKKDLAMGDHPIAWRSCIGKGRSVYSALGHSAAAYEDTRHKQFLEKAILWLINHADMPCN